MKIVICDDNIKNLNEIEELLQKYKCASKVSELQAETFSDPSILYDRISAGKLADIYLLDMIMSEKTGIDIGVRLREKGCKSVIIYITSSDDFALDAYHVHAARYLLKPVAEEDFFEAMDYALSQTEKTNPPSFLIRTADGLISVAYHRIEYIENVSRRLDVHLTDGDTIRSIVIRKSFDDEIGELIHNDGFIRTHKSFLVNSDCVHRLTRSSMVMESGKIIPISKTRTADVRKKYVLYLAKHYG